MTITTKQMNNLIKRTIAKARISSDTTKVAASIIIPDSARIITTSFNHISKGITEQDIIITEENKDQYTIHAEISALVGCAKLGIGTHGLWMMVAGKCICDKCAVAIVGAGISKVFCPEPDKNSRWVESNHRGVYILQQAKVEVEFIERLKGINEGLVDPSKYIV